MKESLENSHPDNHHLVRASTEELSHLPASWYFFCLSKDLTNSPLSKECFGKRLVAYRKGDGQPVVMDARCSHMGADLGKGRVLDDALQCPLHHWEYGPNGCCRHIPATDVIPHFARQTCFPAQERVGILFVFNGVEALFPLPFFSSAIPEELCAAKPFSIELNCPWYTVGANHFDLQHFRAAHDRVPIGEYRIDCPEPYARRASCCFQVAGAEYKRGYSVGAMSMIGQSPSD